MPTRTPTPIPARFALVSPKSFPLVLLIAAPLAAFAPAIMRGEIPWFMDVVAQFFPMRMHAAALLHAGEAPFWTRTVFSGAPLLADPQWGLLYPGHWPMLALPGGAAFAATNAAHVALLGVGVFFWTEAACRRCDPYARLGPLAAGLFAEFSAWTWAHLAFGAYLQAVAWAPWALWAAQRAGGVLRGPGATALRTARWGWASGCFVALAVLAGAPQPALYLQLAVMVWIGALAATARRRRAPALALLFLAVQAAAALTLAAPQWIPSALFLRECGRAGGLDAARLAGGAVDARGWLAAWIGGTGLPEDAEQILYPGWAALALALSAPVAAFLAARRRLAHGAASACLAGGLLIAVASLLAWRPLVPFFHAWAPLFDRFHDPRRILMLAWLGALFLAGAGGALWTRLAGERRRRRAGIALCAVAAIGCADLLQFAARRIDTRSIPAARLLREDPSAAFGVAPGERFFAQDLGLQFTYNYTRPGFAETLLPGLSPLYGVEDVQGYNPAKLRRYAAFMDLVNEGMAAVAPSHFALVRNPESPWLRRFGPLKARGPVDLAQPFLPPTVLQPGESREAPFERAATVDAAQLGDSRVRAAWGGALENAASLEIRAPGMELRAQPPRGTNPPVALWPEVLPPPWARTPPVVEARVTAPPSTGTLRLETLTLRHGGEPDAAPILVYAVGLPRARTSYVETATPDTFRSTWEGPAFPERIAAVGEGRSLEAVAGLMRRSGGAAVAVETDASPPGVALRTIGDYAWEERSANRLRVRLAEGHGGGWLVLSEPFAPGWRAWVDGEAAPVFPADLTFRAVAAPAGARIVEMRYFPPGLKEGLGAAAAGLLLGAWLLARTLRRETKGALA